MADEEMPVDRQEFTQLVGRVAALEDRLAKLQITEEDWKAFLKVSAILGGQSKSPGAGSGDGTGNAPQVHWHYHWEMIVPPPPPCVPKPCAAAAACLPGQASRAWPMRFGVEFAEFGIQEAVRN
jgi:hypothetical protein